MSKLTKTKKEGLKAAAAAFVVIMLLGWLTEKTELSFMIASFGATCAVVFGMPKTAAARAKNILFAYTTTSVSSYVFYHFLGYEIYVMALGVAFATFIMIWENLIHPPAAGIPIFFYYIKPQPEFLLFPILVGCVVIIIARKLYKEYGRWNGRIRTNKKIN